MKFVIKILILLCLFYPSVVLAVVCGEKIVLNISAADICGGAASCPASYGGSMPANCYSNGNITVSADGCVCVYEVCCDDTAINYEDGVHSSAVYSLTPAQNAGAEAQQLFDDYYPSAALPAPQVGYILTGSFEGFVYGVQYDMNGNAFLDFTSWKRGYYTKIGSAGGVISPIPGGGAGGTGGGGLTYEETSAAVGEGVGTAFGTGDDFGAGSVGAAAELGSGDDITDYDTTYDTPERDLITTKVTDFLASNPIVTAFTGSGMSITGASCTVSGSAFGQTFDLSFCSLETVLQLFGSLIVLIAGLYSFFIAWGIS